MRRMGTWLALIAIAALAVVVACSWGWATQEAPMLAEGAGPVRDVVLTGGTLAPAATPAALVALAGVLAIIATRGAARVAIGIVIALAGLLAAVSVLTAGSRAPGALIAGLGALVLCAGGAAVVRLGRGWPGLGRRFERVDTASPWDALDRGEDPTDRSGGEARPAD